MKLIALLLGLLICASAQAATYQIPPMLDVTGASCGIPQPYQTQTGITSTDENGTSTGRVWRYTRCSSGGRGTSPTFYTGCVDARWDVNGILLGIDVVWQMRGKTVGSSADCITS